jgi:polyhydroxyalkanoate synthesis regulator phasin
MSKSETSKHMKDELIREYVEGEMTREEARSFEERLKQDQDLASLTREYKQTMALLRTAAKHDEPVSPEFLTAVQRKIRLKSRNRSHNIAQKPKISLSTLGILGIILALIIASFSVLFPSSPRLTIKPERVVVYAERLPGQADKVAMGMTMVDTGDGQVLSVMASKENLDALQKSLAPLLVPVDKRWLGELKLDEPKKVHILILPKEMSFAPIQFEF